MQKITFKQLLAMAFGLAVLPLISKAQFTFTNSNTLFSSQTHSGNSVTVVDVNNDGLDDILIMDQATNLVLELQHSDGTYTRTNLGSYGGGGVWGMAAADVDHNGWKDVACGAGSTTLFKLFYSSGNVTATATPLTGSYFVQNVTFGDFDNDGWVDLAVCDDNDYMKIYKNNSGTMSSTTTLITTNINPGLVYGSDPYDSGNYGSVWTDFDNDGDLDLYIAHCRQSTSSYTDERRRDRLFVNDGTNHYAENALAYGLETVGDFKQTWTTSFGDMDNDGDLDVVVTNHGEASQIYQNDGTGHFIDVTAGSGFTVPFDAIESTVEDFDNDGFLDILVTGPNWVMYRNNGNGTYTQTPGVMTGTNLLSMGIGDLNHDGKSDIFASYGTVYNNPTTIDDVLYLNTTSNTNHYITFDLTGTVSNVDAIGARVTIYGPWGKQIREVRAGDSYGTSNSMQLHFGLGSATTVDSARIDWPSHLYTNHFTNLAADQFVTVIEGGCTLTGNFIPGPGPYVVCNASSTIPLNASSGFTSYLWSNSATTSSITAGVGGYSVTVTNASGCTGVSPTAYVVMGPDQSPTITAAGLAVGATSTCPGTVQLSSSVATSYLWTGPGGFSATTQTITPTASGQYYVTIPGTCGLFTSDTTTLNFYNSTAPTGTGASSPTPASLTLNATGTGGTLNWYDAATAGTNVGSGTSYTTPVLSVTTNYYVDETVSHPGSSSHTSLNYYTGATPLGPAATNASTIFNVLANCTLSSVKVYTDNLHYGLRRILLMNSTGTVLDSVDVTISTDTTVLPLNWSLTIGNGYQLGTRSSVNVASFGTGYNSPAFYRNLTGAGYPITSSPLVTLTGNSVGTAGINRLYYFYDWIVQASPDVCTSARTAVTATIGPSGISSYALNSGINIYPNPSNGILNAEFLNALSGGATIKLTDITGRITKEWILEKITAGQKTTLDLTDLSAGTYFISLKTNESTVVNKIVLTK